MPSQASDTSHSSANQESLYRRRFVGRKAELQRLKAAFNEAVEARAAVVVVAGEPGIGKTALCDQLAAHVLASGGRALRGHCAEVGSTAPAYLPLVEALDACFATLDADDLQQVLGSAAEDVARIVPELRERFGVQFRPAGDPSDDRWRLMQAVFNTLRNLGTARPVLLIMEDLHEADRGTLDLLVHLSRHLDDARFLVLGTYRDVEVDRTHPLSSTLAELRRQSNYWHIPLRGLSVSEVHQLYCDMLGEPVPNSRSEAVHHQTEGNPLFVQEVLRFLLEAKAAQPDSDYNLREDVLMGNSAFPEGLRDVVGKRMSRLTERANQVLQLAAVIGREFRLDVLQQMSQLPADDVIEALELAHARAIIEVVGGVSGSPMFHFTHTFFRQMLYEEIFMPRRMRLHRIVGSVLEKIYAGSTEAHASELAMHFGHSSDQSDLLRAITYAELAAQRAMRVYAYAEAAHQLERALQLEALLDNRDVPKHCDLLLDLGEAMLAMGQQGRAVTSIAAQAFGLAESHRDAEHAARAAVQALDALSRPWHPITIPSTSEYQLWVARADMYAAPGTTERVYADVWLGMLATATDRPEEVSAPLLRAVELARQLGDDRAYGTAAAFALSHLMAPQQADTAVRLAREFVAHRRVRIRTADLARGLAAAGRFLLGSGDRDAAQRAWDELEQIAAQSREPTAALQSLPNVALRAFLDGNLERVVDQKQVEDDFGKAAGLENAATLFTRCLRVRALYHMGQASDALLEEFRGEILPFVAFRAFVRALLGRCDEALELRSRFTGMESASDATSVAFLALLLDVSNRCHDTTTSKALMERLAPFANRMHGWSLLSYGRLIGEAAMLFQDPAKAREYLERALGACQRIRCRPELAITRLDLAQLLATHYPAELSTAADYLQLAIDELVSMHMQVDLRRANELSRSLQRQQITSRPSLNERRPVDPLTDREREVLDLLARGMSNREIAAALVISEGTAGVHVKHVLNKLGLKSRAQVAAWVFQDSWARRK